ncbi:hypothetical protein JOM56_008090 [Amanita muscaria]
MPLNDLQLLIDYARDNGKTFIEIPMSVLLLKNHYMANENINPHRWTIGGVRKLKRKTSSFKHEFIVARVEYHVGNEVQIVQYICVDRTVEKRSGNSPGLHISGVSNQAHIFSADDPATDTANNVTLMSLVPGAQPLTLPGLLVLANHIHNVAPKYRALGTNCFWFADAMIKALEHYGFENQDPQPGRQSLYHRLVNFVFRKSVATDAQMNRVNGGFPAAHGRFFNFEHPAI